MSVIVESRTKRNFPKPTINKNDKIQRISSAGNVSATFIHNDDVQFDCAFKIKETSYIPEKECVNIVREANNDYFYMLENVCVNISLDNALSEMELRRCCILDLRDCRTYQNGHIKGALLFNCQKRMMIPKAKKSWDSLEDKQLYDSIIMYNQNGETNSVLQDFMNYVKKDFKTIFFLKGGYDEFFRCAEKKFIESFIPEDIFEQYHFSPTNDATKSTDVLNATISEILPCIFIGNELDSKDLDVLKRKKITHILNVTNSVPCTHEGHFIYKRLSATDCNRQDMRAHYDEAFSFIDDALKLGGRVLVHCWAGVSRSATIVAAYLLKHTNLTVLQTIYFLQSKRSIVEPNFNFLGQLERYYCDLEKGVESRTFVYFKTVDDFVRKMADIDAVKDLSLSSESSSSSSLSPISPRTIKPYFNFRK